MTKLFIIIVSLVAFNNTVYGLDGLVAESGTYFYNEVDTGLTTEGASPETLACNNFISPFSLSLSVLVYNQKHQENVTWNTSLLTVGDKCQCC